MSGCRRDSLVCYLVFPAGAQEASLSFVLSSIQSFRYVVPQHILHMSASCGKRPRETSRENVPIPDTYASRPLGCQHGRQMDPASLSDRRGWVVGPVIEVKCRPRLDRRARRAAVWLIHHVAGRCPFPSGPVRSGPLSARPSAIACRVHRCRHMASSRQSRRWHQSRIKCGLTSDAICPLWCRRVLPGRFSVGVSSSSITDRRTTTVLALAQVRHDETQYY